MSVEGEAIPNYRHQLPKLRLFGSEKAKGYLDALGYHTKIWARLHILGQCYRVTG